MKKKLNLLTISAALLLGLTACGGQQPAASSSAPASDASSAPASEAPSTPASEAPSTPAVDYPALAEAGYQQISATYDDWAKGITTDQTIYLEVTVEGVKFTVSYTVAEAAKNYLKIEGNKLVVTTDKEDHLFAKAVKVNVGIGELVYYSHELNVKVLGVSLLKIADIWDLKDGDAVTTRGKVTALYGTSFFMQDGATGTEVYSSKDTGVKVGDYVETVGVISIYNGLVEVKPDTVTVLENDGGVEEPVNIELGAQTDISAAKLVGGRIFSATDLYVKEISLGHSSSSNYDYIQGTVIADGKDGTKKLTLRIEDRYAGKEMMESWGVSYDDAGKATLGDKIHAGDLITLNGILNWYNAPQISLGTVTKVTAGEAPADPVDISATFAEVLTAGKALTSGESSYDYYVFDAYVVKNTGTNYFLAATADADTSDDKALFEIYKASEANQAKLLKGAKVTVKTKIKNFNGQVEDAGDATLTVTVVEAGEAWVVNYTEVTVAQAIAAALALEDGKTSTELYKVTGYIVAVTYAWSGGTVSLTLGATADATDVLTVFKLAVPEADKDKLVAGAQLTIGGNLQNYVKDDAHTPEFVNGKVLEWGTIPEATLIQATFAEAMAAGKALASGKTSTAEYEFEAYVVKKDGTNYFLAATADADTSDVKALFEIYKASEENQAKLLKGAKVKVKTILKNYKEQVEDAGAPVITVVTAGEAWDIPVINATFAEVMAAGVALGDGKSSEAEYEFEAYVVKKDGTNYFLAATADADTSDVKALFEIYKASEENQAKLLKGAKVKVKAIIKNYQGQIENGAAPTITVVTAGEAWEEPTPQPEPTGNSATWEASAESLAAFPADYSKENADTAWDVAFGEETIKVNGANIKKNISDHGNYLMMGSKAQKAPAYIFNETAFGKAIKSITITTSSGASDSAKYAVNFGTAAITEANSDGKVNVKKASSYTFTNEIEGAKFFQLTSTETGYNGQIVKIVVTFAD